MRSAVIMLSEGDEFFAYDPHLTKIDDKHLLQA